MSSIDAHEYTTHMSHMIWLIFICQFAHMGFFPFRHYFTLLTHLCVVLELLWNENFLSSNQIFFHLATSNTVFLLLSNRDFFSYWRHCWFLNILCVVFAFFFVKSKFSNKLFVFSARSTFLFSHVSKKNCKIKNFAPRDHKLTKRKF